MAGFAESIRLQIERIKEEIDTKCYKVFEDLASAVIYNCPILRGNLINDFWAASNSYNYTTLTPVDADFNSTIGPNSDITGSGSLSRIKDVKNAKTFFGKDGYLTFSTSVHYAHKIEYLGHSSKAPSGFIRNSVLQVATKYG